MNEQNEQKQEPKKLRCGDVDNFAHLLIPVVNEALEETGLEIHGELWNKLHDNLSKAFNKLFEVTGVEQPDIVKVREKLHEYGRKQYDEAYKQLLDRIKLAQASSPSKAVN